MRAILNTKHSPKFNTKTSFSLKKSLQKRPYCNNTNQATPNPSHSGKKSLITSYQQCVEDVKRLDYPHYFCSRYLSAEARVTMFALRSFNLETAAIKSQVPNTNTAQLRLQWWRSAIDSCFKGESVGHPVTDILVPSIKENRLTKGWFLRLLDMRQRDLFSSQPKTLADLEKYCEDTSSSLIYLGLESIGIRDTNADHAASHLGKAMGLVTLIRAIPYHSKSREIYIPTEITAKYGLTSEQLFKSEMNEKIGDAVYDIASLAHDHLEMARELTSSLPKDANLVLLPTEFYADYLERLRHAHFNPWDPSLNHYSALTRLRVVKNYYTKKF